MKQPAGIGTGALATRIKRHYGIWERLGAALTATRRGNRVEFRGRRSLRMLWRIRFHPGATGNRVAVGERFRMGSLKIEIGGSDNRLTIGDDVRWGGRIVLSGKRGQVSIGDRCHATEVYLANRGARVTIGADCLFSHGIEIRSADMHPVYDLETGARINPPADVSVGDHCWLGARSFLGKGANIPNETIVGACAVVTTQFRAEHTAIAGNPGRVVRTGVRWER